MATIRLAVGQVEGVTEVEGDHAKQTITVGYEPATVTPQAIRTALEEIGYASTLID
ncbi:MAG: heavy-metal-associated domain-containing protein [Dehalococcoidia bacterium]